MVSSVCFAACFLYQFKSLCLCQRPKGLRFGVVNVGREQRTLSHCCRGSTAGPCPFPHHSSETAQGLLECLPSLAHLLGLGEMTCEKLSLQNAFGISLSNGTGRPAKFTNYMCLVRECSMETLTKWRARAGANPGISKEAAPFGPPDQSPELR